jgi:hypothetical protein
MPAQMPRRTQDAAQPALHRARWHEEHQARIGRLVDLLNRLGDQLDMAAVLEALGQDRRCNELHIGVEILPRLEDRRFPQ